MVADDRGTTRFGHFPEVSSITEELGSGVGEILARIDRKVYEGNTLHEILDFLFHETSPIMPCDRIGLAFLTEDGQRVVSHYVKAKYEPVLLGNGYSADLKGSTLEKVMKMGEPRIIGDLSRYAYAHPKSESTKLLLREGVRSSMTCPLIVGSHQLGFLFRSSRYPNAYSDREVNLHLAMAERLGQAVEKAYRIEQLEETNRAYMEMLGFVSHEIKNPLASLITEGKVLQQGYLGNLPENQRDMVGRMVKKAEFLLGLTRSYLNLSRLEEGKMTFLPREGVDLASEVLDPSIEMVVAQVQERKMTLDLKLSPTLAPAQCDPELLKIVLINLLGNAANYGNEGGKIEISADSDGKRLTVSVWNEGPGFPESEKPNLFIRFSRLQTPELKKRKGTGIGLYTSWWVIKLHGGRIWADSQVGRWAKFSFEIPQPLPSPNHENNR